MQITDVRIRTMDNGGKMKAVASVTFDDEFVVHDIKIVDTRFAVNAVGAWSRPEHGVDISRIAFSGIEIDAQRFCRFYYKHATGSVFDGLSFRHVRGKVQEFLRRDLFGMQVGDQRTRNDNIQGGREHRDLSR